MSTACVACHRPTLSFFGKRLSYSYFVCDACGTLQLVPMPTETELREAYAEEYAVSPDAMNGGIPLDPAVLNGDHAIYHHAIVETLKSSSVAGPILEVGCGFGGLGRQALQAGLQWEGIDLSHQAVAYCQTAGLPVREAELSAIREQRYGAVVLCFVFEHLSSHDHFLSACRQALVPDGRIVTLHPTARSARLLGSLLRLGDRKRMLPRLDSAFAPPWHTTLISIQGMREIADRNGFRIERVLPTPVGRFGSVARRTAQFAVECVNGIGWHLAGERWPLTPAHLFVLQRV